MMKIMHGHSLVSYWFRFAGRLGRCTQCAPEIPQLWNILLNEAMAPVIPRWQQEKTRFFTSRLVAADGGRKPRTWADAAPWCNQFGFADDLLVAISPKDVQNVYSDLPPQGAQD